MKLHEQLWRLFTPRQRLEIIALAAATLCGAALEALAVGLVMPFIQLLARPGALPADSWMAPIAVALGVGPRQLVPITGLAVLLTYVLKNAFLGCLTYWQFRFVYDGQSSVQCRLLAAYLHAPWTFHLQRNTAELLRNVTREVDLVFGNVLTPSIVLVTEVLVACAIVTLLVVIDPMSSVAAIALIGASGALFYRSIRSKTETLGSEQQLRRADMIKWVNQGLGGIKETKVLGRERFFVGAYAVNSVAFARAAKYLATVSQLPRFVFETFVVGAIAGFSVLTLLRGEETNRVLSVLALFAAAGLRLMPSMGRIVASVTNIKYHRSAVTAVHGDLDVLEQSRTDRGGAGAAAERFEFEREIELRDVSYGYPGARGESLSGVSLKISKGSSIAFFGPSGSGKTTLVDVILGLLQPREGLVLVDGRDIYANIAAWQRQIGYIPQTIYLSDDTIRRNVAFGQFDPEIDEGRVWVALRQAQLEEFVLGLRDGLETLVGERGVRLSGGQRQRVGIARALYHDPELLILDEATASLDIDTENEIARAIEHLSKRKTLVIIAHRPSTIEKCDIRFEVRAGGVHEDVPGVKSPGG